MSTIRQQSIISSGIVYIGFALGFINTLIYARALNPDQYGLIGIFFALGNIIYAFANMGMPAYVTKFYPYYRDRMPVKKIDLMGWAFVLTVAGFIIVTIASVIFRDAVIRKFSEKSSQFVIYYYWILPFGFGLTFYTLLENLAWQLRASVLTNFLREFLWRIFVFGLILLYISGIMTDFGLFIKIYSFTYILLAAVLLVYLLKTGQLYFSFSVSVVTKKFFRKIRSLVLLAWTGTLMFNVSFFFAQVVIAAVVPGGLTAVAIFTLAQFIGSLVQAPQRGIAAAAIAPLSQAWKDKDYGRIDRIYRRSSINLLLFSVAMFILVWINFTDGVIFLHLKKDYLDARPVFLFIGIARLVDMGTGVNTQIIGTSSFWRFDFFSGMILVSLTIPLNYVLAKNIGVTGPAIADLVTFAIYNGIRWLFLYRKFGMQPFTIKTLYTLLLGLAGYLICDRLFGHYSGFGWMVARSTLFILIFGTGALALRLSEDILLVWRTIRKRLGG
ncbi:MAG TPA: lipopolysaccharide biosynthesis protein [Puia sp.]|jgi:O-antigen/teichoic acid export membrane protein